MIHGFRLFWLEYCSIIESYWSYVELPVERESEDADVTRKAEFRSDGFATEIRMPSATNTSSVLVSLLVCMRYRATKTRGFVLITCRVNFYECTTKLC
jgi:hypothetical protein